MMNETLYGIWQFITPILMALVTYFLKDFRDQFRKDIDARKAESEQLKGEIATMKKDISKLENTLPLNYVLREDYIRTSASMENKLDRILERTNLKQL